MVLQCAMIGLDPKEIPGKRPASKLLDMRLRAEKNRLKIEHSIIDGLRPVLERMLRDNADIRRWLAHPPRFVSLDAERNQATQEKRGDACAHTDALKGFRGILGVQSRLIVDRRVAH